MLSFAQFVLEGFRFTQKGWMSPSGVAHDLKRPETQEHYKNHHPDLPELGKQSKRITPTQWPKRYASLEAAQKKGYTRYGSETHSSGKGFHYIHYDHQNKDGVTSALHALHHLSPKEGDSITVTHKPWTVDTYSKHDREFDSPGEAAAHIIKTEKE